MKLVMTLLVRDEADIVAPHLDFHFEQGVDHVVVTDNGSKDGTHDILRAYSSTGRVTLLLEFADDYAQARWVTRMARMAATDLDADWVINSDADEFWWPAEGTLQSTLARVRPDQGVVVAHRTNFVPRPPDERPFYERMTVRETRSRNAVGQPLPPKVCHRASAQVEVTQGNHDVTGVTGFCDDGRIEILHFPLRTFAQLDNKIALGGAAYERNTELSPDTGGTWRHLYALRRDGRLRDYYDAQELDDDQLRAGIAAGTLVEDTRLRDVLRRLRDRPTAIRRSSRP